MYNPWSTLNRNYNYVNQRYGPSMNESSVIKMCYDSINDVEGAHVCVLDDIISACDRYKQCDLFIDELLLTI